MSGGTHVDAGYSLIMIDPRPGYKNKGRVKIGGLEPNPRRETREKKLRIARSLGEVEVQLGLQKG